MEGLAAYGSDSGADSDGAADGPALKKFRVTAAPDVSITDIAAHGPLAAAQDRQLSHNLPYADLARPVLGPQHPHRAPVDPGKNHWLGSFQEATMNDDLFKAQERTFRSFKYALDPSALETGRAAYVGDVARAAATNGADVFDKGLSNPRALKRKERGTADNVEGFAGPWAGFEGEEDIGLPQDGLTAEEQAAAEAAAAASAAMKKGLKDESDDEEGGERTTFHGREERDYQGRTYMHVPQDLGIDLSGEPGQQECFLPKRVIHTWTGHTKGVNAIRFFPKSGHMLLSCSMDGKVKLWDCYHQRQVLRTFIGHSKGVRDISFNNDGTRFLTASYDKWTKLWDTETGKCISRFSANFKIPYVVRFNPDADKQNIFLAGCADKKIYQFDTNTGDIVQEYDQHLGAVNTITFVDENRRFVSTSDDKTMRVWEYDIPVVIKYVAEPSMHSMPAAALHPSKKYIAFQSLDNQIVVYSAKDRFRLNRKKRFAGHLVAGYACQPNFSADGRFIASGDSEGKVWFWDWKTCRVLKKVKAHDGVVMDVEWHPQETSKVATCSWDGTIKYWD
ncbi:WD40-repeat-containing domain protein [Hyaloraphidium curvatum]|nr:WD40-repeat-containing domain protein [Hyaloraphidium curvatum]